MFNRLIIYLKVSVCFGLVIFLAGFFGRSHFLFDLASHLRLQVIFGLLVASLLFAVGRSWRWAAISIAGTSALALTLLPFYLPSSQVKEIADGSKTYKLLVMNVLTRNRQKSDVTGYIKKMNPDFFALLETDRRWVNAVRNELGEEWKHQKVRARGDNFGILFFSKIPFESCQLVYYGSKKLAEGQIQQGRAIPSIAAKFDDHGKFFRIVATHPLPPLGGDYFNHRNAAMMDLAEEVGGSGSKDVTLICGDLNCTPWSPWFSDLLEKSGLKNSAEGNGLGVSWTPFSTPLLGLPIDHVLVGKKINVFSRKIGPRLGSDHRPILVKFQLEGAARKSK